MHRTKTCHRNNRNSTTCPHFNANWCLKVHNVHFYVKASIANFGIRCHQFVVGKITRTELYPRLYFLPCLHHVGFSAVGFNSVYLYPVDWDFLVTITMSLDRRVVLLDTNGAKSLATTTTVTQAILTVTRCNL